MFRIVAVQPLRNFRLALRFNDGVVGEVDLSHLAGHGVFVAWNAPGSFEQVQIGGSGELCWGDQIDLCPDALYLRVTKKTPEEVFPAIAESAYRA